MQLVGVSVHTVEEAIFVEKHGGSYLMAGHIFATDCKKGLMPRGIEFLKEICAISQYNACIEIFLSYCTVFGNYLQVLIVIKSRIPELILAGRNGRQGKRNKIQKKIVFQ